MSSGLYSGISGLALGAGLFRDVGGLWSGASGFARGGGAPTPPGYYLEAIPTADATGAAGVISQLYTNLTGTLTYSKVSGDARISINASTGEISTSAPIFLGDSAAFIAKAVDTVSGTYIEAPITLVGSVPTGSRFLMEDGASFFLLEDGVGRVLLEAA